MSRNRDDRITSKQKSIILGTEMGTLYNQGILFSKWAVVTLGPENLNLSSSYGTLL